MPRVPVNLLWNDDCFNVFPKIKEHSVDLVLVDPPYGTTACKWDSVLPLDEMWEGIKKVLKPHGTAIFTCSMPFTAALAMSNISELKYEMIWEKPSATGFLDCKFRPLKAHENILIFSRAGCSNGCKPAMVYIPQMTDGDPYSIKRTGKVGLASSRSLAKRGDTVSNGQRYPRSIVRFTNETGLHPTQKPAGLMEYLINTFTSNNNSVLDFCMGSGTTGVACGRTGRNFLGIEKDKDYFEIAKKRIEQAYSIY